MLEILEDCGIGYDQMAPRTYVLQFGYRRPNSKELALLYQECPSFVNSLQAHLNIGKKIQWEKPILIEYDGEWGYPVS